MFGQGKEGTSSGVLNPLQAGNASFISSQIEGVAIVQPRQNGCLQNGLSYSRWKVTQEGS